MLPLCTGVERFESVLNCVFLPLIVTGLKVQKLMIKPAAPVATKQCFFILEEEGCGNILVALHGIYQDKLLWHCFCNNMEKFQLKITLHSSHQVSALVKQIKVCPLLLGDTSSLCSSKRYTVVVHVFTFLADGFAFT